MWFCTNSRSELLALFGLLHVVRVMGLPGISVFGDSSMVIDWVKGWTKLKVLNLEHGVIKLLIWDLVHGFTPFNSQYIYIVNTINCPISCVRKH